ncbi:MAG: hypothetical protein LQ338_005588, partial [Usnochroma carphineum]
MTDPISIASIATGSASLALQLGQVIHDLHNLSERYRFAELTVSSISSSLETVQFSWRRIATILERWTSDEVVFQDDAGELFAQLNRSLKAGSLVIAALEEDLSPYKDVPERRGPVIRRRAKVVWNEQVLKGHQERVRDQAISMNLLISVLH